MKAITKVLAGGVAIAALAGAAPATAQYYPGYGYGYGGGAGVVGQVINQVLGNGYGYGGYGGYGVNSQAVVNQCAGAVQDRLNGGGYGYSPYGAGAYGGGRVLGISRVEPRSGGGMTIRGVATSGRYGAYGAYGQSQGQVDLTWKCKTDYRGMITDIDVNSAQSNYGYGYQQPYTPYGTDYSQYGYRRY